MPNKFCSSAPSLRFALVAGAALASLAGTVLTGWLTHSLVMVQVLPGASAMRFNTAVSLLLLGVALFSLGRRGIWLPRCVGTAVAVFALTTLSQDLLGINLGIDNLLFHDWSGVGPNPSGRMAINTAICFVLSGISVASLSFAHGRRMQPLLECLCGSIVLAIGAISAFGYLSGLEAAYGWGGSIGMAVHTAASFTLIGVTLVGLALAHERCWSSIRPVWLPLPVSLAVITATVAYWQALCLEEQKQATRATQVQADKLATQIAGRLLSRVESLERMANRWVTAGRPQQEHWEADARMCLKHFPDFQAVAWINPEGSVAWLVPLDKNQDALDEDASRNPTRSWALQLAREKRQAVITPAVNLIHGGQGVLIFCPIFRDERLEGYYSAIFRISKLVSELAHEDLESSYQVQIVDNSQQLYTSMPSYESSGLQWSESRLDCGALTWHVRMRPMPAAAIAQQSWLPVVVLCGGLLVAVVLALAIHYAQRASERSQAAERAAAELRASQTRFRAIFDQTFQFIGLLAPDGTVLEANRTALAFAGIAEADVLGRSFWETPWWTHSPTLQQQLRSAIAAAAAGQFQRFEATHPDSNGQTHYVDFSLKPVYDDRGRVALLIPEGRDVSDRIQAETLLRESQKRFELAVRGSSDGIWDWNYETGETYYSPRFKRLLGYDEHDSVEWTAVLHPEEREAVLAALQAHLTSGVAFDVTCRLQNRANVWLWFRIRGEATRGDNHRAKRMAGSLSDISALKQVEEQLIRAARLDKLTSLPNRALLLDRLQHRMARAFRANEYQYAVMFLDFDRFKIINDSLGHEVGDALLREIADRLRENIRSVDSVSRSASGHTAARLGGDEFVVLLDELDQVDDVHTVADRLLMALSQPYQLGSHEVHSTASIGIVLGSAEYENADDVLRDADTAMYEAKRTGKARYVVFDDSMRQRVQRRLQLENDLRKAIGGNQLSLAFQPVVSLTSGEIRSVEVLLRWHHPSEGLISPAEFIPIAEECDLIHSLGEWVLRAGCQQMANWIETLGAGAPATVSINLSRKQFLQPDLYAKIQQAIADTRLPSDRLQLEITEVAFGGSVTAAIKTMRALRTLGIHLAIDDFGTGGSSFAAVHQFPIDMLKVDRSLLIGIENSQDTAALIHALAVLVRNLGIEMVAEGVESLTEALTLQELGCQYAQGFLFATAMSAREFEEFASRSVSMDHDAAGAMAFEYRWAHRLTLQPRAAISLLLN